MSTIIDIHAREILDSRGNPTVEVDVLLDDRDERPGVEVAGRLARHQQAPGQVLQPGEGARQQAVGRKLVTFAHHRHHGDPSGDVAGTVELASAGGDGTVRDAAGSRRRARAPICHHCGDPTDYAACRSGD